MSGIQKQQQSKQTQAKSNAKKTPEQETQSVSLEQLVEAPETMRPEQVLAAQKQLGNQVVQRALDGKKKHDAMTDEQGYLKGEINNAIQSKRGGGSSLPDPVREVASKNLKHDFSDVRIHTDEKADELSQSINARAFTIGKDIFFKKGVFAPGSKQGRETIMHELTHVVQQSGSSGASGRLKLGAPDTSHEKQADQIGKANSSVDSVSSASNSAVQRIPNVGGSLAPIEEVPDVGGRETTDKAPSVGGMAPIPEEDTVISQAKADRPQGILNTEIRGFDKSKLKHVPSAKQEAPDVGGRETASQAPDVGGRLAPTQEETPDVGGHKDDDEVQMQPDMAVVQREEMPEEELQMQPDAGGVVQREISLESEERKKRKEVFSTISEDHDLDNAGKKKLSSDLQTQQAKKRSVLDDIKGFDKRKLQDSQARKEADAQEAKTKEENDAQEAKKTKYSKENLLKTIKDPSSSSEDAAKAQKMMKSLHKRKGVLGGLKRNESRGATGERLKALKAEGRAGKEGSFEKYEAEYGKASTYEKFSSKGTGGKAKMIGKGIGKGVLGAGKGMFNLGKRFVGKGMGDLSEQLFGKEEKKEEKKEAAAPAGGGGAGIANLLEEKIAENQKLKAENEELKAKVAN